MKNIEKTKDILLPDLAGMNEQIKIVPKVDLCNFQKEFRFSLGSGVASRTFCDYFFTSEEGKAIFKTYDNWGYKHIKNIRCLNELLCEKLMAQVSIPCVRYVPATYTDVQGMNHTGLITYNVLEENQSFRHIATMLGAYDTLSLAEIASRIDSRKEKVDYSVDIPETIKRIFAIEVFDILTAQGDRSVSNVNFVHDKTKQTCSLDFVFDNELAYFSVLFTKPELECGVYTNLFELLQDHSNASRFLTPSGETFSETRLENAFADIAEISKQKPEFMQITNHILKNLNPTKAIKELEADGHTIPESFKRLVQITHTFMKTSLESALENQEISEMENE